MTLPRLIQVRRFIPVFLGLWLLAAPAVRAEETAPFKSPTLTIPAGAVATPGQKFDPAAATKAWLDSMPADKRAKSDAYFEGTYWLLLWNFLLGAAIAMLLLNARISARIRDFAERTTRFK